MGEEETTKGKWTTGNLRVRYTLACSGHQETAALALLTMRSSNRNDACLRQCLDHLSRIRLAAASEQLTEHRNADIQLGEILH